MLCAATSMRVDAAWAPDKPMAEIALMVASVTQSLQVKLYPRAGALVIRQATRADLGSRQQHTLGRDFAGQVGFDGIATVIGQALEGGIVHRRRGLQQG